MHLDMLQTKKGRFHFIQKKQFFNQNIQTRDKIYCRFVLTCVGIHFRTPSNQRVQNRSLSLWQMAAPWGGSKENTCNTGVAGENMSKRYTV